MNHINRWLDIVKMRETGLSFNEIADAFNISDKRQTLGTQLQKVQDSELI